MESKFRYSLENFRGIAIIFVMFSHVVSLKLIDGVGNYLHYLLVDATAWFVFISGYLFYYLEIDKFNYGKYLSRKLKFVLLPYLILSVPAIWASLLVQRHIMLDLTPLEYTLWSLISGGTMVAPMWFIPMIFIFFLLTPIFRILARSRLIIPVALIGLVFSVFSFRPFFNNSAFFSFLHFAGFYLFGIAAAKHASNLDQLSKNVKSVIILLALAIFLITGVAYPGFSEDPIRFIGTVGKFNYVTMGKLALLVVIFLAFERYLNRPHKTLAFMAKISFGLFFIHGFMIVFFGRWLHNLAYSSLWIEPAAEIGFVILGSIAIVVLIKKITGKWSRYVIGC